MRLFHVSEESDIEVFHPRTPLRDDISKEEGLIWAIDEARLPNFITPRNCPRVTYHINKNTTKDDINQYISSSSISHVIVLENKWYEAMKNTTLYIYGFDPAEFELQDEIAGYYVSKVIQKPVNKFIVIDLLGELFNRNVEVRFVDNLWDVFDKIVKSSFNYSMCRMKFAQLRSKK